MRRRGESADLAALRRRWRRWTAIVELFAHRRRGCRRVDPRAYQAIHGELTESCRRLAATADEPRQTFYRSWEDLARPWLTPSTLAKADQEILVDLLIRCRRAEREMEGRARALVAPNRAAPVLLLLVAAVAAVLLLSAWGGVGVWSRALDSIQSWSVVTRYALKRANDNQRLFLLSIIIIPLYMYVVSRTARS